MPITSSAKKALRASKNKKVFNDRRKRVMRSAIKHVRSLVTEKKVDDARKELSDAYQAIDKAYKRGVIKKNTAARKKSRLTILLNKLDKK